MNSTCSRRYAFLAAAYIVLSGCGGPTSPDGCDPDDQLAARLRVECTPSGTGLQCRAYRQDGGYCADSTDADVTPDARWFSSDTFVGFFSQPGVFQTRSSGEVRIHAEYSLFFRSDPQTFMVSPAQAPERLAAILIGVRDATTRALLADARVEIVPERGNPQTCLTNAQGECRASTYLVPIQVTITKSGYQPAVRAVEPDDACYCASALIELGSVR